MVAPLAFEIDRELRVRLRSALPKMLLFAVCTVALVQAISGRSTAVVDNTVFAALPLDPVLAREATAAFRRAALAGFETSSRVKDSYETDEPDETTGLVYAWQSPLGSFDDVVIDGTPLATPVVIADESPASEQPSEDRFIVMFDPGHGGSDPGAVATNGLTEKELTLDIAQRAELFLGEISDIEVKMTRKGDTGLSRQNRVRRIKHSGADMVVSLHFNHLPQSNITLVESFYASRDNILESRALQREAGAPLKTADDELDLGFTEGSARLANLVQNRVFSEVASRRATAIDAGTKADTLFVLTRSFIPGALVELTCISNPAEAERLNTEAYRNQLAAAIADAVRDYRDSLKDRPLGAVDV